MNLVDMKVVYAARSGDLEPLAKYLESGGYVTEEIQEFLVAYLRGEIKWKRGNKRTYAQVIRDKELVYSIRQLSEEENVSLTKAIEMYSSENDLSIETVKSAHQRAKHFSDSELWEALLG